MLKQTIPNTTRKATRRTNKLSERSQAMDQFRLYRKLEHVQSAKYLVITITDDLDWGQHITEISCKATKTLCFLRHNLALAPRHTKEVAYKTSVRPQLKYAAPIWQPYHDTQIDR